MGLRVSNGRIGGVLLGVFKTHPAANGDPAGLWGIPESDLRYICIEQRECQLLK